jgi:hypothetical protein
LTGGIFDIAAARIRPRFGQVKSVYAIQHRPFPRVLLLSGFFLIVCAAALPGQPNSAIPAGSSESKAFAVPPIEEKNLVVDAASKEQAVKPGQESCVFVFAVKNISKSPIVIFQVRTSCGCTVATMPSKPWTVPPGGGGEIKLTLDLHGESGTVSKSAIIEMPTGYKNLEIKAVFSNG